MGVNPAKEGGEVKVLATEKLPIKMWLDDIEDGALAQAKNLANLPFIFKHIALMPDCHQGYGMPIGGVMATKGVVIPNAVGVDIGCGVCAVRTELTELSDEDLRKKVMRPARKQIPVGKGRHREPEPVDYMPQLTETTNSGFIIERQFERARKQIGTLGGGNHFIEVQKGSDGFIWVMIHSGSRNLGKQVADHYNKLAVELNERYYSQVPKDWELAFLPLDTPYASDYMVEMNYCVNYAKKNRELMMNRVLSGMSLAGVSPGRVEWFDIAHNYAAWENHFKQNAIVHRKGATKAYQGEYGLIPGSQGSKSYIVRGKGNEMSFKSCSHGAGRRMGRKAAQRELDLAEQQAILDSQNIVHSVRNTADLDEAPGAYKDIMAVMDNQTELVDIEVELTPLAVIKG